MNKLYLLSALLIALFAVGSFAQSPNTAAMVVNVVDQNDAAVPGANVNVTDELTGQSREAVTTDNGATFAALSVNGHYTVKVNKSGFGTNDVKDLVLRVGETSQVTVKLAVAGGTSQVTVLGTAEGVRADPQIGKLVESKTIDETPILGRKFTTVPLLNSAFRSGKGTGDLFVNQTYFVSGVGSRRAATYLIDGISNDEGWGRQTALAAIPTGAVQEVNVMTNAFSAEFGWTSGPALNIVTKSGTNHFRGEVLGLFRPGGGWQAKSFSTDNFCPKSVAATCVVPALLTSISPIDIPDKLWQGAASIGGPIKKNKTFFFVTAERTGQDRTAVLSPLLPAVLLQNGQLTYNGHYRQTLFDGRVDHNLTSKQMLMFRFNYDHFYDDNPQDAVSATTAFTAARRYTRGSWTVQANHTAVLSTSLLNEFRFAYLDGDPVTKWEANNTSTTFTRGAGNGAGPFTSGQSRQSNLFSRQLQFADTLSWTKGDHYVRFGTSIVHHQSGGFGNEPGQATLGTFTFLTTGPRNTLPLDQLTIADVQSYSQPINFGTTTYDLRQWLLTGFVQDKWRASRTLTIDAGLRYDRQTLTTAKKNFEPRIGFAWDPIGDSKMVMRGGYAMYYTQIRSNEVAGYLLSGLDGISTYTANPGQTGFPTCLTCAPVNVDPRMLPTNVLPPRDIQIIAGKRAFYQAQFTGYGLDFSKIASLYPDTFVNPRSQIGTFGVEREMFKGFFVGSDYVRQHVSNIDRTVDLNAPTPFLRTAAGQCRSANCNNTTSANLANLTRPILPVNGGVRQINAIMNLGVADYQGLQTQASYRGSTKWLASVSFTASRATNTTEPDGNGIGPNESFITELGEQERGLSLLDQHYRTVIQGSYNLPWNFTVGTLMQFATGRPFNATTGVDNNGDGIQNDRPVINGSVMPKSFFRGPGTQDISAYVEDRIRLGERARVTLRLEGFNLTNQANMLARGVTVFGNGMTANTDFGAFVGGTGTSTT
ncbi:MAG TPA: TonB-dependent receptor, partial [Pyrinomonadaceae bacterium]